MAYVNITFFQIEAVYENSTLCLVLIQVVGLLLSF